MLLLCELFSTFDASQIFLTLQYMFPSLRIMMALAAVALCAATLCAATADTRTRIFDSRVHSLQVSPQSNTYMPPVVALSGDEAIRVSFDLLDYDVHYLRYSVVHCNADWQPSQLVESEYVGGFNYADVTDYAQSTGTFAHYYNYGFTIPNADMPLKVSGNYLLKVYDQSNPDDVLFQTRFSLCESTVLVAVDVTSRTDIDYNESHQQVAFSVTSKPGVIRDPYNELTAVVTQNVRTEAEVSVTRPLLVSGNEVRFDHNRQLIFPAGNEYRRMEMVNVNSLNMGVERMEYFEPYYHATLRTDGFRAESPYNYDRTQYGHFTVRCSGSGQSNVEADYVVTHFSLFTGQKLNGGELHVDGAFAAGMPSEDTRMRYDETTGCYVADILLKQGAYNYQYLWQADGVACGSASLVEGDKYQTVNQYLVKVYDRPSGERYDRLVGFGIAYSGI